MRNLIFLVFAACAACGTVASPSAQSDVKPTALTPAAAGDTLARIRTLVGTPDCASDSQCHTLALGGRACGGPDGYLAWSSAKTSQAELEALGERYKQERRAADQAVGAMSTCQVMTDPGAVCRAGVCQLNPAQAGAIAR